MERGELKKGTGQQVKEETKTGRIHLTKLNASDTISLVTVIVTIVAALVVPFSQLPVLDYEVKKSSDDKQGNQRFEIAVRNHGVVAAENVIISFKADKIKFEGFSSLPYLAKHFTYNTTSEGSDLGKAVVEIKELPPRSYTVISATLTPITSRQNETELMPIYALKKQ